MVAGEDHEADLPAFGDDLVVGLEIEGYLVERSGDEGFAFLDRAVVLGVGPAACDDVVGDFCISVGLPGERDQPDGEVGGGLVGGEFDGYAGEARDVEGMLQRWGHIHEAMIGPVGLGEHVAGE